MLTISHAGYTLEPILHDTQTLLNVLVYSCNQLFILVVSFLLDTLWCSKPSMVEHIILQANKCFTLYSVLQLSFVKTPLKIPTGIETVAKKCKSAVFHDLIRIYLPIL